MSSENYNKRIIVQTLVRSIEDFLRWIGQNLLARLPFEEEGGPFLSVIRSLTNTVAVVVNKMRPYKPKDFWERIGSTYESRFGNARIMKITTEQEEILRSMLSRTDISSILEIGCGTGRLFRTYEGVVNRAVGLDISRTMLEKSTQSTSQLGGMSTDFVMATATNIPFVSESFDCVVAVEVLLHVPPQDINKVLSELSRVSHRAILIDFFRKEYFETGAAKSIRKRLKSHNFLHDYLSIFSAHNFHLWELRELESTEQSCFFLGLKPD